MLGALQPGAPRQQQEERGAEQREVPARGGRIDSRGGKPDVRCPRHEIERRRRQRREHHQGLGDAPDQPQEGQREHVEADLAAEDRIGRRTAHRFARSARFPSARDDRPKSGDSSGRAERQRRICSASGQRDLDAVAGREHRAQVADAASATLRLTREPRHRQRRT